MLFRFLVLVACCFVLRPGYGLTVGSGDTAKMQPIATLEKEISILQTELRKCEKSKQGWKAATVVGSLGVLATGISAGVKGKKIKDKKAEISGLNQEISNKKSSL